jgi:Uma2 family endonuclease
MPATAILTSKQYLSLPEAFDQNGNRIKDELIGGEVVKMPPASHRHDRIKNRIKRLLDRHLDCRSVNSYTIRVSSILYFHRKTTGSALISSKY